MLHTTYHTLRKELAAKGTFEIQTRYGVLTVMAEMLIFTSSFIWLIYVPHFSWAYWLCEAILGLSAFRFLVILHECGHYTLFRQPFFNTLVGYLVSPFCFHPYEPWRQIHNAHHQWVGIVDKDPTATNLETLKQSKAIYSVLWLAWRLWLPLGMLHHILSVYWLHPLKQLRQGQKKLGIQGLVSIAIALLPHALGLAYWGTAQYLILITPLFLIALAWNEAITIPFHAGLYPLKSQYQPTPLPYFAHNRVTRNTHLPPVLAIFLTYNFNLHVEHHLFPYAPWYQLPQIKQALSKNGPPDELEVRFPQFMIHARSHEPAILFENKQTH